MTKFNLEQALQGAPVRLDNGYKAYLFADTSNIAPDDQFPLIGGYGYEVRPFRGKNTMEFCELRWTKEGENYQYASFNIAGMWED